MSKKKTACHMAATFQPARMNARIAGTSILTSRKLRCRHVPISNRSHIPRGAGKFFLGRGMPSEIRIQIASAKSCESPLSRIAGGILGFTVRLIAGCVMSSYALFDVLNGRFRDGSRVTSVDDQTALKKSIQDHLEHLLNARQGVLPHLPDYGLPDLTAIYQEMPYSVDSLAESVKATLLRYEPRLVNIKVVPYPMAKGDFVLHFQIAGQMLSGEQLRFQTYFLSGGYASVAMGGARTVENA